MYLEHTPLRLEETASIEARSERTVGPPALALNPALQEKPKALRAHDVLRFLGPRTILCSVVGLF